MEFNRSQPQPRATINVSVLKRVSALPPYRLKDPVGGFKNGDELIQLICEFHREFTGEALVMVGRRVSAWLSSVGAIALSMVLMLGTVAMVWGSAPAIAQADDFTKANLLNQDFSGQDLRNSEFTKASLRQSDLSHTDLRGVSFFAANLERVDLTNADLRYATLDSARFVNAN